MPGILVIRCAFSHCWRSFWWSNPKASGDCDEFDVRFPGSYDIANLLTHQGPCHWRDIRDRTAQGIGFVLANNSVGSPASIIPQDGHRATELNLRRIGWRSNLSRSLLKPKARGD